MRDAGCGLRELTTAPAGQPIHPIPFLSACPALPQASLLGLLGEGLIRTPKPIGEAYPCSHPPRVVSLIDLQGGTVELGGRRFGGGRETV